MHLGMMIKIHGAKEDGRGVKADNGRYGGLDVRYKHRKVLRNASTKYGIGASMLIESMRCYATI